ncbi:MAG: circadian clock protein KaiC [Halofilum sp. (in: g-proteobacteria)]
MPTRIRGVDEVLQGGLPAGRTTLVAGGPGTGKTMLGLEFLYRAALAGEPGLFVTFEERSEAVRENARAMGWDLEALEQAGKLIVIQAELPPHLVLSGEFSIDGLLAILSGQAQATGARQIVVDAVDVLMRLFQDPLRQQSQFQALHHWLQDRGMTALLTAKAPADQSEQQPLLDYMADCVIHLDQRTELEVTTRRLHVLKYRGSAFLRNEHPYTIAPGGIVMMPLTQTGLIQQSLGAPISSGDDDLDTILGGGFRRASAVLLAGSGGTGKTTMASVFTLSACHRDERVLYVSFEQSEDALVSALLSPGIDLRPALASGQLYVLTARPESMGVEDHLLRIFRVMERLEPQHVVVDAISACHRMGTRQAGFDFLVRLLTWCRALGITSLFTNQMSASPDVPAYEPETINGLDVSSLVDTVLLLDQIHTPAYQRRLLVLKSRGLSHSHGHHTFTITDAGLNFDVQAPVPAQSDGGTH